MGERRFTIEVAEAFFNNHFAPWVQEMNIRFEKIEDGEAILRVPFSDRLNRQGGTICGQAIMALADTAMVFAIFSALDKEAQVTTVSQTTSFLRPATNTDLFAHASIIKPGRSIIYGEIKVFTDKPAKQVAHITNTCMRL